MKIFQQNFRKRILCKIDTETAGANPGPVGVLTRLFFVDTAPSGAPHRIKFSDSAPVAVLHRLIFSDPSPCGATPLPVENTPGAGVAGAPPRPMAYTGLQQFELRFFLVQKLLKPIQRLSQRSKISVKLSEDSAGCFQGCD